MSDIGKNRGKTIVIYGVQHCLNIELWIVFNCLENGLELLNSSRSFENEISEAVEDILVNLIGESEFNSGFADKEVKHKEILLLDRKINGRLS